MYDVISNLNTMCNVCNAMCHSIMFMADLDRHVALLRSITYFYLCNRSIVLIMKSYTIMTQYVMYFICASLNPFSWVTKVNIQPLTLSFHIDSHIWIEALSLDWLSHGTIGDILSCAKNLYIHSWHTHTNNIEAMHAWNIPWNIPTVAYIYIDIYRYIA